MRVIRVFPRRTSYTPTDDLAFVGDPPLFRPEADEVHVSVAFTWDLQEAERLAEAWALYYPVVRLGGPAIDGDGDEFVPGMYIRPGVTFTSRGCPNSCPYCLVDGPLRLLEIKPGHVVQDNNVLATGRDHLLKVFEMLRRERLAAVFSGGLQSSLVDDWVVDQFRQLRIDQVFFAADTPGALEPLRHAVGKLSFLRRNRLRCYVMIGQDGETIAEAEARLIEVWRIGCVPFAQLYQPPEKKQIEYGPAWRALARTWCRPAAIASKMRMQSEWR